MRKFRIIPGTRIQSKHLYHGHETWVEVLHEQVFTEADVVTVDTDPRMPALPHTLKWKLRFFLTKARLADHRVVLQGDELWAVPQVS